MDQSKLTKTWIRWLAGRKIEEVDAQALANEMITRPEVAQTLMEDLSLHRQLKAMQTLEQDDFSFVGQAVARFETAQQNFGELGGSVTEQEFESGIEVQRDLLLENTLIEAPPLQVNSLNQNSKPASRVPDRQAPQTRRTPRSMVRWLALATCILLMGSIVWFAYEMGRRAGPNPSANNATSETVQPNPAPQSREQQATPSETNNESADPLMNGLAGNATPDEDRDNNQKQGNQTGVPQTHPKKQNQNLKPPSALAQLPEKAATTFAEVTQDQDAVWVKQPADWPRLGTQFIELESGTVTVELDRGGEFTIQGPARFSINDRDVNIELGQAAFIMPDFGLEEFFVNARNNQIQPEGVARFQLNVDEQVSDLELERGAVEVNPWFGRMVTNPMQLEAGKLDRLTIDGHDGNRPAVARLTGEPQTQFEGWVNFQDRVFKSKDADLVDDVIRRARRRFTEAPQNLGVEWKNLTDLASDQMTERFNGMPPGNLNFPNPPSPEEMMKQAQKMMEQMQKRAQGRGGNPFQGGFQWSFEGNNFEFQSTGDLKSMNQRLLGPFADLADQIKPKQGQ